jgi:hypothetical protein
MAKKGISLHIGLNEVDPNHYAGWSGPLNACEADADDMAEIARSEHFGRVVLLLTADATRSKVLGWIIRAAEELAPGDLCLLTYSGHGGQLPDRNDDEPDALDETWCLHDGEVVDDELYQALGSLRKGVRALVLSDSCHSGTVVRTYTALRAAPGARAALGEEETAATDAARYRVMPGPIALRTYQQNRAFYDGIQKAVRPRATRGQGVQASVRLISGCQDNQLSLDGAFNGLFTATLLRVWKGGAFAGCYGDFHREIVRRMPPTQTPNHSLVGQPDPAFDGQGLRDQQ